MASPQKLAANRASALRSTGPKTAAGKAASRRNATRHGLTGKHVIIENENPEAYEALRQDLIRSWNPANPQEDTLVEEIAQCFWRLQRARALEADTFDHHSADCDPVIRFNIDYERFDRLRRYMTAIERAYHRAIQQLERTQQIRARQDREQPQTELELGFVSQKTPSRLLSPPNRERNKDAVIQRPLETPETHSRITVLPQPGAPQSPPLLG